MNRIFNKDEEDRKMTTCSSCQTSIQKQYEYCPKCGNKVQYEELKKLNEEKPVNFYEQQNIVTRTSDGPLIRLMMWGSLIVYLISLWIYSAYFKEQHNRGFFFQSEENVMSVFVPILLIVVIQFVFLSTSIKTNQKKVWIIPFSITLLSALVFFNMYRELDQLQLAYGISGSIVVEAMQALTIIYVALGALFLTIPLMISLKKR